MSIFGDGGFDAREVEPAGDMDLIPAGTYKARIIESEEKPSKQNPQNRYLALTFEIIDGQFKGRRLWENINLINSNGTAVQIARQQMSAICRAVGVLHPKHPSQLHDISMMIGVKVTKRSDTGDAQNKIKSWKSIEEAAKESVPAGASNQSAPWEAA
ncbi:MAG: DUF669 domain-containing protein [Planctomycetota bacterium]